MSRNKVQFQKSISIHSFINQFGTEEQCRKHLFSLRWPNGFHCPYCGHDQHCHLKSRPLYQCNQCHHQSSILAGTLFAGTKLPLTIWFLAIYLIVQEKNGISALELSRELGISYNATWRLKQKIMQAMKERDDELPLSGFIQLDDAYWGGVKKGKRGRGARNKSPFVAAVAMNEDGHPMKMRFSMVTGFRKGEIKDWASHHIEPASLVISDGLSCFNAIESADSHHLKIVTGGGAASVELPYFTWVNTMISNVKNSMHGTYHAIKRKHLPRYLGEFCYKFNHRYDLAGMLTQLLNDCIRTPAMPARLLKLAEVRW